MLRTRLFLSLLPIVVILLATGIFAIALISRLADSVDDAFAENYQVILASHQMSAALAGMNREVWAYQYTGGECGEQKRRFEESLAQQLKRMSLPGEKTFNEQLAAAYQDFQQAVVR